MRHGMASPNAVALGPSASLMVVAASQVTGPRCTRSGWSPSWPGALLQPF